jgi:ribose-phosphate pyrophosphokinase
MIQLIAKNKEGFITPSHATQMHFPAGEAHISQLEDLDETPVSAFIQGANPDDLIMLAMASDYANRMGGGLKALMPYLPGARADRGTPCGAEVYAHLINSMNLKEVICFDPHSPVITGLIHRLTILDTLEVLKRTVLNGSINYSGIISPDEGSRARSGRIADAVNLPLIKASKHRDFVTGKLSGFSCEALPDPDGRYLVVDDICDGGGTFIGLAEVLNIPKENLDLWVSHGVFSGKAARLKTAYGQVYTTNSHPGHDNPDVAAKVIDLLPFLMEISN